ncbi:zinc finger BED domain-containing protein 4-like [Amia ocellicauda]|uniref:zinc finger BED domain-containing protein 4-like n=1 Tax=Amia ocellicauda TaxID=2972642 RepID=UPI003463E03B|nr:ZBED4 protein [Amia calva]
MAGLQPATPKIVVFGFRDYAVDAGRNKRTAVCKVCGSKISDSRATTSNFTRHFKQHPERYEEYLRAKLASNQLQSPQMSPFIESRAVPSRTANTPRQTAITDAILTDLIISCNMPLSAVENVDFHRFMSVVDGEYSPVGLGTITARLELLVAEGRAKLQYQLAEVENVSVTVDIWSDRRMGGYLGITAHWMRIGAETIALQSHLLACSRFKGPHTICEEFEQICDQYNIKNIDHILYDYAANMKRALTTCFPGLVNADEDDHLDDADIWNDLAVEEQERVDRTLSTRSQCRLQGFAHTLQLVVGDALQETNVISPALANASRISALLHTSPSFGEELEMDFGQRGAPASVLPPWNVTLRQLKALVTFDYQKLCEVLEVGGHKESKFTEREWSQVKELVEILTPFGEATDLTQGEKVVTIGAVIPCVLSLNHHLEKQKKEAHYLGSLIHGLHRSLHRRFRGIFVNVRMSEPSDGGPLPFSDTVYLKAAVLDPSFGTMWLDHDVLVDGKLKEEVSAFVKDLILQDAAEVEPIPAEQGVDDRDPAEGEEPGLFSSYRKRQKRTAPSCPRAQLDRYLDICDGQNSLLFWAMNRQTLPSLFKVAMRALAVPASSAEIERVFSHGGVVMRPHRARLGNDTLSNLIFCKCNTI